MKKIIFLAISFFLSSSLVYAGGGLAHMFIAQESIQYLPDPELRNLLLNYHDAYVVGAYYPDSGYIKGAHYGEDSHWDPFIYAFAEHLNSKYSDPIHQNPKLVAFLFGCAAHRVSDEIMHRIFYPHAAIKDFKNNGNLAHQYGDLGIDLLLDIDRFQQLRYPHTWWVPLNDLLSVYHRMNKSYTKEEIIWGNSILSLAGIGEKLISAPAYFYLKWRMPWVATHYYTWPPGGILMDEQAVAIYQNDLWYRLKKIALARQGKVLPSIVTASKARICAVTKTALVNDTTDANDPDSPQNKFAETALKTNVMSVNQKFLADGSVELTTKINSMTKISGLLRLFIHQIFS